MQLSPLASIAIAVSVLQPAATPSEQVEEDQEGEVQLDEGEPAYSEAA